MMLTLASFAIKTLTPYLPAIAEATAATGKEMAAKALYWMVATAFKEMGWQADWDAYVTNPVNTATVERLLATALHSRPQLAGDIEREVRAMTNDHSYNHVDQSGSHAKGDMVGRDKT